MVLRNYPGEIDKAKYPIYSPRMYTYIYMDNI